MAQHNPERAPAKVRRKALDLLARREHARQELARKLTQRDYDADVISAVLDALEHEGLLSDSRFTESFIHAQKQRGQGPLRIRAALRERGVSDELIDGYLDEQSADWLGSLSEVHAKRFGGAFPETLCERARQARFLHYRGFTSQQVKRLFRELENAVIV